ncbi:MAG: hypothetical protein KBC26_01930 [Candidatus Pacebacteria bacterium]|nr:hypothetical protein [Candidatus Paceibacterota bacterium]
MVQSEKMEKEENKTLLKKGDASVDEGEKNTKINDESELEEYDNDEEDEEDNEGKDTDEEEENSLDSDKPRQNSARFDGVDIFLYVSMAVIGDLGDSIWVTRVVFGPATVAWLYLKGVDAAIGKNIVAQLTEMVPFVGWLPISTVAAVLTIWQTNNPESFKKTFGHAADVMKIKGKILKK